MACVPARTRNRLRDASPPREKNNGDLVDIVPITYTACSSARVVREPVESWVAAAMRAKVAPAGRGQRISLTAAMFDESCCGARTAKHGARDSGNDLSAIERPKAVKSTTRGVRGDQIDFVIDRGCRPAPRDRFNKDRFCCDRRSQ